jgi:hypothetical protein
MRAQYVFLISGSSTLSWLPLKRPKKQASSSDTVAFFLRLLRLLIPIPLVQEIDCVKLRALEGFYGSCDVPRELKHDQSSHFVGKEVEVSAVDSFCPDVHCMDLNFVLMMAPMMIPMMILMLILIMMMMMMKRMMMRCYCGLAVAASFDLSELKFGSIF